MVSGVIDPPGSPSARILDRVVDGSLHCLLSVALLTEYRVALLRPRIARRHGRTTFEIDVLLGALAAVTTLVEVIPSHAQAPDPNDNHLWALMEAVPEAVLVTGDRLLRENPPEARQVLTPREFVDRYLGGKAGAGRAPGAVGG